MSPAKRVLCVDDDKDICELLTTMLGFADLEAIAVPDTTEALRLMEKEQFSLYVIDGQMLGVSGLEFCAAIRKADKTTPIVFFSGHASASDLAAGKLAGANAYIVKPEIKALISTVKRLLEEEVKRPAP